MIKEMPRVHITQEDDGLWHVKGENVQVPLGPFADPVDAGHAVRAWIIERAEKADADYS